jgi:hypothetical protein
LRHPQQAAKDPPESTVDSIPDRGSLLLTLRQQKNEIRGAAAINRQLI